MQKYPIANISLLRITARRNSLSADMASIRISQQLAVLFRLFEETVLRARLQEYAEEQYEKLVPVAKDMIRLVLELQAGDVIDASFVARRDALLLAAQSMEENLFAELPVPLSNSYQARERTRHAF